jgi:hypothetical protein
MALLTAAMRVGKREKAPTVPGPNAQGCTRADASRDISTSTDIIKSPAWRRRGSPLATETNYELRKTEWPKRRTLRALQIKVAHHQGDIKLPGDTYIEMGLKDTLGSARLSGGIISNGRGWCQQVQPYLARYVTDVTNYVHICAACFKCVYTYSPFHSDICSCV